MTPINRSRYIRWWLGWQLVGSPQQSHCQSHHLSKQYVIYCLQMRLGLRVPLLIQDRRYHSLNKLPQIPARKGSNKRYRCST
jgi:hypothetical protein